MWQMIVTITGSGGVPLSSRLASSYVSFCNESHSRSLDLSQPWSLALSRTYHTRINARRQAHAHTLARTRMHAQARACTIRPCLRYSAGIGGGTVRVASTRYPPATMWAGRQLACDEWAIWARGCHRLAGNGEYHNLSDLWQINCDKYDNLFDNWLTNW